MERPRLFSLHRQPGVTEEARRQAGGAVDQFTVDMQRRRQARQHVRDIRIIGLADAFGRGRPQVGQATGTAFGKHAAQRAFQPQHMAPQSLAVRAAGRQIAQHLARCGAERGNEVRLRIGPLDVVAQHERKVVAQLGEVGIRRQQGRPQLVVQWQHAVASRLAGHVEDDLVLRLGDHVHRSATFRRRTAARLRWREWVPGPAKS